MPIRFRCSECGRAITVPDKAAGRKGRCPGCGASQSVPTESTTSTGGETGVTGGRRATGKTGRPTRKRSATANLDVDEIVPGEDDEDSDDEMAPVEMDDDIRSLLDSEDDADAPATGTRRGRPAAMSRQEKRQAEKQAYRDALEKMKDKQKGGRIFLWFVFSLLLIPTFTAAAGLLGGYVALNYAEDPETYSWFETPASWFGLDEKARQLNQRGATPVDGADAAEGDTGTTN